MRLLACLVSFLALPLVAQKLNPVKWELVLEPAKAAPGSHVLGRLTAKLEPGWHIYSLTTPKGGPTPSTFKLDEGALVDSVKQYQPVPHKKFDKNFNLDTEVFEGEVTFLLDFTLKSDAPAGAGEIGLLARYQACTDKECLPRRVPVKAAIEIASGAPSPAVTIPAGYQEATGPAPAASSTSTTRAINTPEPEGLGRYLLVAFGFGIAAIFTPCVFPMIPITLSFFLNREGATRADSVRQALLFCVGIIVLFSVIGLGLATLVGASGVVQLGSNPWVNGFLALVFLGFGLSLLGAFEITLPSGLLTKMDRASQQGGVLGTLLMGFTFSLASFACVGPFMGTLLAGSVQRGGVEPVLGMATFASGLASPFFLLALFPAYLQRLPRAGGWMMRVKIVLGFVVLAIMLKPLSSVDQVLQLNILTRERFLAIWFVLFLLPALYLLGFLRMEGIGKDDTVGVGRVLGGAAFAAFAMSLIPGMFGAGLGELDSYVPLAPEVASGEATGGGTTWRKNDLSGAIEQAKAENKRVLVAFTGYACTNCHWMKANMFTKPAVKEMLKDFVMVELYTDGTDAASEQNQKLQESSFATVAIPYYVIYDTEQKPLGTFAGLTRDVTAFISFLKTGA